MLISVWLGDLFIYECLSAFAPKGKRGVHAVECQSEQ